MGVPAVIQDRFFTKLTERMRAAARALAAGIPEEDICLDLGFQKSYLRKLKKFPPFQDAYQSYLSTIDNAYMAAMMRIQGLNDRSIDVLQEDINLTAEDMVITRRNGDGTVTVQADAQMRKVRQEAMKLQLGIQGISPIQKQQSEVFSVSVKSRLESLTQRWSQKRREMFQADARQVT